MRILVIDEWLPYPLDSGKKIRTFNLLSPLARHHDITYLCYADPILERDKIESMESSGFKVICIPPVKKFTSQLEIGIRAVANLFDRTPLVIHKHYSRQYQRVAGELIQSNQFDLVHCEWTHYGHFLQNYHQLPKFLSSHNIECIPWLRFSKAQANFIRRTGLYLEWKKMKSFEQRTVTQFDHIGAVSENDAQIFKTWFSAPSIDVIPNGVDNQYYKEIVREEVSSSQSDLLVFSASMDAFVNQDAGMYFVKSIFPQILQRRPQTRFMMLGRNPPAFIQNLANDRIIVTGTVNDLRPFLASANISVVPLRVAGGSRLKILEAFSAGIPVVSTSTGAEGLDVLPGKHLLIADDESTFADCCIQLLENPTLQSQLVKAAKTLVADKYDWSVIYPKIERAWEKTIWNFDRKKHKETTDHMTCEMSHLS